MRIATHLFVHGKLLQRRAVFCVFLLATAAFSALPALGQRRRSPPFPRWECLEIQVLDPSSTPMLGASVSIGDREELTDANGLAMFCDLGDSPHVVTVSAPNFQMMVQTVDPSVGTVVIALRLEILTSEIVVVGTRSEGREPLDSPVPVELVPGERLRNTGHVETGRALQMLAPSFNFPSSAITDGTDSVRPATLRGKGDDMSQIVRLHPHGFLLARLCRLDLEAIDGVPVYRNRSEVARR